MITTPQRKLQLQTTRRAYRTLQGWALGTLIEQGVVNANNTATTSIALIPMPGTGRVRRLSGTHSPAPRPMLHCRTGRPHARDRRHLPGMRITDSTSPVSTSIFGVEYRWSF
jgi:hypothetical protein